MLSVLAIRDKGYGYALTLGCFLTNIIGLMTGANPLVLDAILGTLATFVACMLMYYSRNILTFKQPLLAFIIPAIINGIIIGAELAYFFSPSALVSGFVTFATYVFISEFIIVFIFGLIVYKPLFKLLDNAKIGV